MNIDFIKWICEKAGWGFHIKCDSPCIAMDGSLWSNPSSSEWKYRYPLLLQRAIECVNREGSYEVNQDCDHIAISETFHNYKYFFFQDQTEDQAKESALKYIYEQETTK